MLKFYPEQTNCEVRPGGCEVSNLGIQNQLDQSKDK